MWATYLQHTDLQTDHFKHADSILNNAPQLRESFFKVFEDCNKIIGIGTNKTIIPGAELQVAFASVLL